MIRKLAFALLMLSISVGTALAQAPTGGLYSTSLGNAAALSDTDTSYVCQNPFGCSGSTDFIRTFTGTQLTSYFRSKFSVSAPLSYNSSTGAFSVSAVTDLGLPPGFSPTVGTCNSTLQHITATGTINSQDCIRAVTSSASLIASDSGFIVKANGSGIVLTAFNPIAATQGVTYQMMGDGTHSFTVTTVSGTAIFQGCSGAGGTSLTVPAGAFLAINTDNTTSPVSYACMMQGGASPPASNVAQGVMRGDATTINCVAGVCGTIGAAGAAGTVFLSTQSGASGSYTWTGLATPYNDYELVCAGIVPVTNAVDLMMQFGEGGGPTWETSGYSEALLLLRTDGTFVTAGNSASTSIVVNGLTGYGSAENSAGFSTSFRVLIHNLLSTLLFKQARFETSYVATGQPADDFSGSGTYSGNTNAITAIRIIPSSGGIASGSCTLYGYAQ